MISIKEKNRLKKLAHKWKISFKERYKLYRNKLTSLLNVAKDKFSQDQLLSNQGNPKLHWKSINNILGRSANTNNVNIDLEQSCDDIPNALNDNFLRVGGGR